MSPSRMKENRERDYRARDNCICPRPTRYSDSAYSTVLHTVCCHYTLQPYARPGAGGVRFTAVEPGSGVRTA